METRSRTIVKTISWRIFATIITGLVAWGVTGEPTAGVAIGLIDTTIKFAAYYFHERAWVRIGHGYEKDWRPLCYPPLR